MRDWVGWKYVKALLWGLFAASGARTIVGLLHPPAVVLVAVWVLVFVMVLWGDLADDDDAEAADGC